MKIYHAHHAYIQANSQGTGDSSWLE